MNNNIDDLVKQVSENTAKARDAAIVEQLNEFISRGLIVIEDRGLSFMRTPLNDSIEVRTQVVLKLKDQGYIEKLEKENKEMTIIIDRFKEFMKSPALVCVDCGTTKDVSYTPCPFDQEINGNNDKINICGDCENQRAMDI